MSDSPIVQAPLDPGALSVLGDKASFVLEEARRQGATDAEVGLSVSQGLSVSARLGEVETLEFHRDKGVSVTVYQGQRKGSASSSDDSEQSLKEAVAAAMAIARHTGEDEYAGLAPQALLAQEIPDLDLYHPWALPPREAVDLVLACEAAGRKDDRIVNSEGATVSSGDSLRVYANSAGFQAGYPSSSHSLSCVLVGEQDGVMQRDYWYDAGRQADRLASAEQIGARAAERVLARLGAERIGTGDMPVLFSPEVAAGVIGHFLGAIQGGALYRRASFLLDKVGEQLFPSWMQIGERPRLLAGNSSAPFDNDGLATRDQQFIRDGVLEGYALGLYASRRLGLSPTANGGGVRNVTVADTGQTQAQLLEGMGNGVLVTELMGSGVNPVTGDYSRGAAGFRVVNGQLAGPVEEFTIAGNLIDMFRGLAGAGTDRDLRGNVNCGSLLMESMKVAGNEAQ